MIGRIQPIHDPADPRVEAYRNQKDAWLRARHRPGQADGTGTGLPGGLFMAEGSLVVEQLLRSRHETLSVLVAMNRAEALASVLERVPSGVPIYGADQAVLAGIAGFEVHRGLLACGRAAPAPGGLELAAGCRALVVLEDLTNHDNVGSVFRSVAALGGEGVGVLLSPRCCDPLYRKSLRVSMGHALRVPFAVLDPWAEGLQALTGMGYEVFALDPAAGAEPIDGLARPARPALVLGAEGPGLTPQARAAVGRLVVIPMAVGVDSLNIAVAAAVALQRLVRPMPDAAECPVPLPE